VCIKICIEAILQTDMQIISNKKARLRRDRLHISVKREALSPENQPASANRKTAMHLSRRPVACVKHFPSAVETTESRTFHVLADHANAMLGALQWEVNAMRG